MAGHMLCGQLAIYIDRALIIDRAEVEQHAALQPLFGNINIAAIPARAYVVGVTDSAQAAFGAEGHVYIARQVGLLVHPARLTACALIQFKLPLPVKALPRRALKLRARVFGFQVCHKLSLLTL